MAERRMFAKTIIDSDSFLDMPITAQLLYFHLCMRADDDGFIKKPKAIMRLIGCKDDDIKLLFVKKFVIPFESGVVVIKHWKIHNYIRKDTYHETKYKEEKKTLDFDENEAYKIADNSPKLIECDDLVTDTSQVSNETLTQVRLGKVRLGKVNKTNSQNDEHFDRFWSSYPKRVAKKEAKKAWAKLKADDSLTNDIIAGVKKWCVSDQWTKDGGQYIPNPATFLNGERWKDDVAEDKGKFGFSNANDYDYDEIKRLAADKLKRGVV